MRPEMPVVLMSGYVSPAVRAARARRRRRGGARQAARGARHRSQSRERTAISAMPPEPIATRPRARRRRGGARRWSPTTSAQNDMRVTAVGERQRARRGHGARDGRPGGPRPAPAGRGRHADRAPPARGVGDPDPDAHRPRRGGRPGDGPRARRRRLPHQAVQPARAAGAHPRAAAPREGAGDAWPTPSPRCAPTASPAGS